MNAPLSSNQMFTRDEWTMQGQLYLRPGQDVPFTSRWVRAEWADQEIDRLRALVKQAGDLLTYGGPDMELQSDDGSDWIDKCDEWFKDADYGMPKPRPADETDAPPPCTCKSASGGSGPGAWASVTTDPGCPHHGTMAQIRGNI